MSKELFVMKAPLSIQVHLGNPSMARIPELTIKQMPECEGGGWFMPADEAKAIVGVWNGFLLTSPQEKEGIEPSWQALTNYWKSRCEAMEEALRGYACSCALGFCECADDDGTMNTSDVACGFNARQALKY